MPELPEVESVRRALRPRLAGRRLGPVEVREPRLRYGVDAAALAHRLPGRRIVDIRRRAKYLLFDLDDGGALLVHLGMSGRLALVPARRRFALHDHVAFGLDRGQQLRFNDARRFGTVAALAAGAEPRHRLLRHLGLEPLDDGFDGRALAARAGRRSASIKSYLMDSRVVVGIGNIYASEALFIAGIHPRRAAGRLAAARWQRLAEAVRLVLTEAIEMGGTTLRDFVNVGGDAGTYGWRLRVYGREDEPCPRCAAVIRRVTQTGRSTYYCPGCQR